MYARIRTREPPGARAAALALLACLVASATAVRTTRTFVHITSERTFEESLWGVLLLSTTASAACAAAAAGAWARRPRVVAAGLLALGLVHLVLHGLRHGTAWALPRACAARASVDFKVISAPRNWARRCAFEELWRPLIGDYEVSYNAYNFTTTAAALRAHGYGAYPPPPDRLLHVLMLTVHWRDVLLRWYVEGAADWLVIFEDDALPTPGFDLDAILCAYADRDVVYLGVTSAPQWLFFGYPYVGTMAAAVKRDAAPLLAQWMDLDGPHALARRARHSEHDAVATDIVIGDGCRAGAFRCAAVPAVKELGWPSTLGH